MPLKSCFQIVPNRPEIRKMIMTSQFNDMTSPSNVLKVGMFLLSSLATSPSFMSVSLLVLDLGQFVYKGLTRNSEIRNTLI